MSNRPLRSGTRHPTLPLPGWKHPGYEILRPLGQGGLGAVYLAIDHLANGREVALKTYPRAQAPEMLRREFVNLRRLNHPAIAQALDFGHSEPDGAPFFTMEYICGPTLAEYALRESPAGIDQDPSMDRLVRITDLFLQVSDALSHLHTAGLLHLDVKPGNILVLPPAAASESELACEAPLAVLIDLGLSQAETSDRRETMGTLPYMAPERLRGQRPDPRADLYSVGATFFQIYTGRPVFPSRTDRQWIEAHLHASPPIAPELPATLERILQRLLAKTPDLRFDDAAGVGASLKAFRAQITEAPLPRLRGWRGDPGLIGREEQLRRFEVWNSSEGRDGRATFWIRGGPGSGRSKMLQEIETRLLLSSAVVVRIDASEKSARECQREIVRKCAIRRPPSRIEERDFAAIFPIHGDEEDARNGLPDTEPLRDPLHTRVAASWVARSVRSGVVLLADNIGDDLAPFLYLVAAATRADTVRGGLVVAADDTVEPPSGASLCDLPPLTRRDLATWLATRRESRSDWDSDRLFNRTGGNPLLVAVELEAGLEESSDAPSAEAFPSRVGLAVERLSSSARDVLEATAVAAQAPHPRHLGLVLGVDPDAVTREARLLIAGSWLRRSLAGGLVCQSERLRDAILSRLTPVRKRQLHTAHSRVAAATSSGRVAQCLHTFLAGDEERAMTLLRRHLDEVLGESLRHSEPVTHLLARAADSTGLRGLTRQRVLYAHATNLLDRGRLEEACSELERLRGEAGLDPILSLRVRERRAHALHLLGRRDEASRELVDAWNDGKEAGPGAGEALVSICSAAASLDHFRGDPETAARWAHTGLDLWRSLEPSSRRRARSGALDLYAILGQIAIRKLDFETAISTLKEGREQGASDPNKAGLLWNNLALAYLLSSDLPRALENFEKSRDIAERTLDENLLLSVLCNIAQVLAKQGRFARAQQVLRSLDRLPAKQESARHALHIGYTRALVQTLEDGGDPTQWREIVGLAERTGDEFLRNFARLYLIDAALQRGDWETASSTLRDLESARDEGLEIPCESRRALLAALTGRPALNVARKNATAPQDPLRAWSALALGKALAIWGEFETAADRIAAAREYFQRSGLIPGWVEASLEFAEVALHTRARRSARRRLETVERRLARLAPDRAPCRQFGVRYAIFRARAELLEAGSIGLDSSRKTSICELLAHAEGDPGFEDLALSQVQAAAARWALAWCTDDPSELERARTGLLMLHKRWAGGLGDTDTLSPRDFLRWSGLAELVPLCDDVTSHGWPEGAPQAMELLSRLVTTADPDDSALRSTLDRLRRACELGVIAVARLREGKTVYLESVPQRALRGSSLIRVASRLPSWPTAGAWNDLPGSARRVLRTGGLEFEPRSWLAVYSHGPGNTRDLLFGVGQTAAECLRESHVRFFGAAARLLRDRLHGDSSGNASRDTSTWSGERTRTLSGGFDKSTEPTRRLKRTAVVPTSAGDTASDPVLIARSSSMRRTLELVDAIAPRDVAVLITGEPGSGRVALARRLHDASHRAAGPCVIQNVASIPTALFEADLFGAKRGAFTGAEQTRSGYLVQAQGGTFVLEGIDELGLEAQQKLLRVLESGEFRALGAETTTHLDVRFVATADSDLPARVDRGDFRGDLFYRLRGAQIEVPPLRERLEDIIPLWREYFRRHWGVAPRLSRGLRERLFAHPWRGNIRELESLAQRLGLGRDLRRNPPGLADLHEALDGGLPTSPIPTGLFHTYTYEELQGELELSYLKHLFAKHDGKVAEVARELGTSARSVYRKLEPFGLTPRQLRRELGLAPSRRRRG